MDTVIVQLNNYQAFSLLKNLEALDVIKILKRNPVSISDRNRTERISEIQSITKNIHIDLSNFIFNREDANNYNE